MLLILGFAASMPQTPAKTDACAPLIPSTVGQAAANRFPSYELLRESDNSAADIREFRARTGSARLGATVGRFTGRPTNDYALLLTERNSDDVILVVATRTGVTWRFDVLRDWGVGLRSELDVQVAEPGHYVRHPDASTEPAEFTSTLPGVLIVAIGQSSEVYFFNANHWINLPQTN